ncbi:hypothetical protein ACFC4G_37795 [Streptomyces sp. NPDC056002]|uniref:hypothetical protein n=1 Tax=Streptomyces sp. NPDC056002 TaxID=3345675 RepID=UPI0035DC174F
MGRSSGTERSPCARSAASPATTSPRWAAEVIQRGSLGIIARDDDALPRSLRRAPMYAASASTCPMSYAHSSRPAQRVCNHNGKPKNGSAGPPSVAPIRALPRRPGSHSAVAPQRAQASRLGRNNRSTE